MSGQDERQERWEARINALLDGELSEAEVADLKREAEQHQALAQAIIDAHALQAGLDELRPERAPASLRAKLRAIPGIEAGAAGRWFGMPRWVPVGAMAAVPLLVVAMVMMTSSPNPQQEYSEAEVLQAREDLMVAFSYIDRIGSRAGRQIEAELSKELRGGVTDNVARFMPFTHQSQEEETS